MLVLGQWCQDTSQCQPYQYSPSSMAKPTLSALNSGRCTNISMPLCPPTSSSVGESLAWRKELEHPPAHHPFSSFHARLDPISTPNVLSSLELGEVKTWGAWLGAVWLPWETGSPLCTS